MKMNYTSPELELICLAPVEGIAAGEYVDFDAGFNGTAYTPAEAGSLLLQECMQSCRSRQPARHRSSRLRKQSEGPAEFPQDLFLMDNNGRLVAAPWVILDD